MILRGGSVKAFLCLIVMFCMQVCGNHERYGVTSDEYSTRANTLLDNVDDTQRQLDNEVRERIGKPKTVWVIHIPTRFPILHFEKHDLSKTTPNNILMRFRREKVPERMDKKAPTPEKNVAIPKVPAYDIKEELRELNELENELSDAPCYNNNQSIKKLEWNYKNQNIWAERFKSCGGRSQSPIDLPVAGLVRARGARTLLFGNYGSTPQNLSLSNDGNTVTLTGHWKRNEWPLVYGGAAHSRRYIFHSLVLHWPSEHSVGSLYYPMESQLLHISAEYKTFEDAVAATNDPQAFLGVVNIYKYGESTHSGTQRLIKAAFDCLKDGARKVPIKPEPLSTFSPPFKQYVCYQGSLTAPPCTESVLWLVRRRSLSFSRDAAAAVQAMVGTSERAQNPRGRFRQPLNDRKIFLFV